jgi:hypothetical protein
MDLIVCFYRQQLLPESFGKALSGDGEVGGLVAKGVAAPSLKARRAVAKSAAATGNSIFKSISSFTSVGGAPCRAVHHFVFQCCTSCCIPVLYILLCSIDVHFLFF